MTTTTLNTVLRRAILATAGGRGMQRFVRRYGMRFGAGRFGAGEALDDTIRVLRGLNEKGLRATTTILGEHVRDPGEARAAADDYERVLRRLVNERLDVNVALKLTHLGLAIDEELAYENGAPLVALAAEGAR